MTSNQPGYSAAFINQHEADEAAAERQRQADTAENERLGAARLAALAAERAAANEKHLEEVLASQRATAERRWLAGHPDRTAADFARCAWPQLRLNLLEEREAATLEAAKAALVRTGGLPMNLVMAAGAA